MYTIREAKKEDQAFLILSIIEADKSSTNICSYCKLLEIEELEFKQFLHEIFEEEITGFEFSVEAFIIVEYDGKPIAASASWIESDEGLPSWQLRMVALRTVLPAIHITNLMGKSAICNTINIKRSEGTLQIESVFISSEHRGKELLKKMIDFHIKLRSNNTNNIASMELLTYNSNLLAEKAYTKIGFKKIEFTTSSHEEIKHFYPSDGMTRWQKIIEHGN